MKTRFFFVICVTMIVLGATAFAGSSTPSVTVSGVTATTPVVRSTTGIDVLATVTPVFDTAPASVTGAAVITKCGNSGGANNDFCYTGNSAVGCTSAVSTTSYAVENKSVTATAADGNSSTTLTDNGDGTFGGTLDKVTTGTDGTKTVTVTSGVSEDYVTTVTTVTSYWSTYDSSHGGSCGGTDLIADTTTSSSNTDQKTGFDSATANYILDIVGPSVIVDKNEPQYIEQGKHENVQIHIDGGSSETPYSVALTATLDGDSSPTLSGGDSGTFKKGNDGIAPQEVPGPLGLQTTCSTPVGKYHLGAVISSQDLGGSAYDAITIGSGDWVIGKPPSDRFRDFNVIPGVHLESQTNVLSQLSTGDYGINECFTNQVVNRKVTNTPGSIHVATTLSTAGACANEATMNVVSVVLTLPSDASFKWDRTGSSPAAHVFVGPSATFDLHTGAPLVEVTTAPGVSITANTASITIDLSKLDVGLGLGQGVLPSGWIVYARAHALWNQKTASPSDQAYVFSSTSNATLNGVAGSNTSSTTIYGNPITQGTCDADGLLTPPTP